MGCYHGFKIIPSFFTIKEGSTSHLGLLPSGKKRETALLGARNRYALRLADHQRPAPDCAGWDRLGCRDSKLLADVRHGGILRLSWLYRGCEEWTAACLLIEGRTED